MTMTISQHILFFDSEWGFINKFQNDFTLWYAEKTFTKGHPKSLGSFEYWAPPRIEQTEGPQIYTP